MSSNLAWSPWKWLVKKQHFVSTDVTNWSQGRELRVMMVPNIFKHPLFSQGQLSKKRTNFLCQLLPPISFLTQMTKKLLSKSQKST
jgi:hypothetical protein